MAKQQTAGLYQRNGIWQIDKKIFGQRLCESTGTSSIREAEMYLAKRIEELRQIKIYGVRQQRTFEEAAERYIKMNKHKASIHKDMAELVRLHKYFAGQPLEAIHMGSLQAVIDDRRQDGVKNRTINYTLQVARRVLNLASREWVDEDYNPWLSKKPYIKLLPQHDSRAPMPISWKQQDLLFPLLPKVLGDMAEFVVNTGCRDHVVCQLRWEWECEVPELGTSVFIVPGYWSNEQGKLVKVTKTGEDRLVILNRVAKAVIDRQRGRHKEFVFVHSSKSRLQPYSYMSTSAWMRMKKRVNLEWVRIHDLRHTFGRRLRAAGVSFEDRQDLLGHKSGRMTTHYSAAEIKPLLDAANRLCDTRHDSPTLRIIKARHASPVKVPQGQNEQATELVQLVDLKRIPQ